ncbi:carbon-nitrogen hydrolase [Butyriboletus roseoflavus]|nr:carbon-nitrogen hydrolase [Butyriboletus roseoflavus]
MIFSGGHNTTRFSMMVGFKLLTTNTKGYMFPDAPSIAPYLEHPNTGPTASFCAALARDLKCYVVAGFPERLAPARLTDPEPPLLAGANAALLYDTTGHLIHTYHKSNLFPTDVTWARPGAGFTALDLPMPFGRTAVAICNDVNVGPGDDDGWHSIEKGPYELAGYCRRKGVRVLVLLNSWLKDDDEGEGGRGRGDVDESGTGEDSEPDWPVLNYWAMRLRPLWAKDVDATQPTTDSDERDGDGDCLVVICNRFGHERGKTFAGSSAMFSMRPGSGKPRLLHVMGEREEGVRVWAAKIGSRTRAS